MKCQRDLCFIIYHDDVIVTKWKYFKRYWPFVRGIYRSPMDSPHKGQWRGVLKFSLICAWTNGSARWWFVKSSRLLWRHCNAICQVKLYCRWCLISGILPMFTFIIKHQVWSRFNKFAVWHNIHQQKEWKLLLTFLWDTYWYQDGNSAKNISLFSIEFNHKSHHITTHIDLYLW